MLEKIEQESLADRAERQIRSYLLKQGFRTEASLPKEKELAEQLGVSRNVVREALSRLRMFGIVKSKKRRGMVMGRPDIFQSLAKTIDLAALSPEATAELSELRLVLETGMADLVFARKTEKDLEDLEAIVAAEEKSKSRKERLFWELKFHQKLFQMAQNRALQRFAGVLEHFFKNLSEPPREAYKPLSKKRPEQRHRYLLDKLREGPAPSFREALREHLDNHWQALPTQRACREKE